MWSRKRQRRGRKYSRKKITLVNIWKISYPTESSSKRRWQAKVRITEMRRKVGSKGTLWDGDYNSTQWIYFLRCFPFHGIELLNQEKNEVLSGNKMRQSWRKLTKKAINCAQFLTINGQAWYQNYLSQMRKVRQRKVQNLSKVTQTSEGAKKV